MTDPTHARRLMSDLGITTAELAAASGLSAPHVGKQVRGDLPLQRRVQRALEGLLEGRAIACLPITARLLRREGEDEGAEACERVWEGMGEVCQPEGWSSEPPSRIGR